jgi:hypothetical protein
MVKQVLPKNPLQYGTYHEEPSKPLQQQINNSQSSQGTYGSFQECEELLPVFLRDPLKSAEQLLSLLEPWEKYQMYVSMRPGLLVERKEGASDPDILVVTADLEGKFKDRLVRGRILFNLNKEQRSRLGKHMSETGHTYHEEGVFMETCDGYFVRSHAEVWSPIFTIHTGTREAADPWTTNVQVQAPADASQTLHSTQTFSSRYSEHIVETDHPSSYLGPPFDRMPPSQPGIVPLSPESFPAMPTSRSHFLLPSRGGEMDDDNERDEDYGDENGECEDGLIDEDGQGAVSYPDLSSHEDYGIMEIMRSQFEDHRFRDEDHEIKDESKTDEQAKGASESASPSIRGAEPILAEANPSSRRKRPSSTSRRSDSVPGAWHKSFNSKP